MAVEIGGLRFGFRVKQRIRRGAAAGPESATAQLVRIRLARDPIGEMRHAARMRWRCASGKTCDRVFEATPEKMHGAALADEARAELFEHPVGLHQRAPEAMGVLRVVARMHMILLEGYAVGDLARHGVDLDLEPELRKVREQLGMKIGDRARRERHAFISAVARMDKKPVMNESGGGRGRAGAGRRGGS